MDMMERLGNMGPAGVAVLTAVLVLALAATVAPICVYIIMRLMFDVRSQAKEIRLYVAEIAEDLQAIREARPAGASSTPRRAVPAPAPGWLSEYATYQRLVLAFFPGDTQLDTATDQWLKTEWEAKTSPVDAAKKLQSGS